MIALRSCPDDCTCRGKLPGYIDEAALEAEALRARLSGQRALLHSLIRKARAHGLTQQEIARAAGITRQRVQQLCDKEGR